MTSRRSLEYEALLRMADEVMYDGRQPEALDLLGLAETAATSLVQRYVVGEALLRASNGRLGWKLYDLHPARPVDRIPRVPRWDGGRCPLLILVAEQGFGDALQFLRFVPTAARYADRVVFAVHDELLDVVSSSPLLADCTVMSKSVARRTQWRSGTRWERLMALPARIPDLGADAVEAYLRVSAPDVPAISPAPPDCLTVGVAWRSTPRRGFPNRSFPAGLARKLVVPGRTRVVALHRDRDMRTVPDGVITTGIGNFTQTARVIVRCDYVVTSDTVTAHLAPALGVRTLICLRRRADWRWGTPRHPTRWYAMAEPLFQDESESWAPVLSAAARRVIDWGRTRPGCWRRLHPEVPRDSTSRCVRRP